MNIFIVLFFCIDTAQVVCEDPLASKPADPNKSERWSSKYADEKINDAKGKANDNVTTAIGKAKRRS